MCIRTIGRGGPAGSIELCGQLRMYVKDALHCSVYTLLCSTLWFGVHDASRRVCGCNRPGCRGACMQSTVLPVNLSLQGRGVVTDRCARGVVTDRCASPELPLGRPAHAPRGHRIINLGRTRTLYVAHRPQVSAPSLYVGHKTPLYYWPGVHQPECLQPLRPLQNQNSPQNGEKQQTSSGYTYTYIVPIMTLAASFGTPVPFVR